MQVWNVLHAACCKYRTQKSRQELPSGHHRTIWSGCIFATKAHIDNRKKNLLRSNMSSTCPTIWWTSAYTSGWDRSGSLGHPCKFQRVSRLGSVSARHLVVGISQTLRRWTEGATCVWQGDHDVGALAHILVLFKRYWFQSLWYWKLVHC